MDKVFVADHMNETNDRVLDKNIFEYRILPLELKIRRSESL